MASYSSYLKTFYKPDKVAQMDMDTTSDSQLGAQVTKQLKPGLQQNIKSRLQQTKQNASQYDADAASRGMGSSTWLTDVKNRNRNAEASDLSTLRANYNQNLYSNLQSLIQNRNSRNQTADNFNKAALNQAYATAQALASQWAMYDKQNEGKGGGGGGGTGDYVWDIKARTWVPKKASSGIYLTQNKYGSILKAIENMSPSGRVSSGTIAKLWKYKG